jgi:hypothetical protein
VNHPGNTLWIIQGWFQRARGWSSDVLKWLVEGKDALKRVSTSPQAIHVYRETSKSGLCTTCYLGHLYLCGGLLYLLVRRDRKLAPTATKPAINNGILVLALWVIDRRTMPMISSKIPPTKSSMTASGVFSNARMTSS